MKKIIKFLLVSTLVAVSFDMLAQVNRQLVMEVKDIDGTHSSRIPLTTASHLKLTPVGIQVTSGDELDTMLSYYNVQSLSFVFDDIDGITLPEADSSLRLCQNPIYDLLMFTEYPELPSTLAIIDMKGSVRFVVEKWHGQDIDVSSLAPGIYLVTVNSCTLKFVKK